MAEPGGGDSDFSDVDDIDVMESEPDEIPRQLIIPQAERRPTMNLATLEAKYQSTLAPVMEEPKAIYSKTYRVGNEMQPLLIYKNDKNWRDIVEAFVKYHEMDDKERTQILNEVREALK